jgi:hypothetical protein
MLFGMSQSLSRLLHQFMPITGKGQPAIGRNQVSQMPVTDRCGIMMAQLSQNGRGYVCCLQLPSSVSRSPLNLDDFQDALQCGKVRRIASVEWQSVGRSGRGYEQIREACPA